MTRLEHEIARLIPIFWSGEHALCAVRLLHAAVRAIWDVHGVDMAHVLANDHSNVYDDLALFLPHDDELPLDADDPFDDLPFKAPSPARPAGLPGPRASLLPFPPSRLGSCSTAGSHHRYREKSVGRTVRDARDETFQRTPRPVACPFSGDVSTVAAISDDRRRC